MNSIKNRIIKHYLLLSIILITAAFVYYNFAGDKPVIVFITDITGYTALFILAFTLVIGPFNLWMKRRIPVSTYLRREMRA